MRPIFAEPASPRKETISENAPTATARLCGKKTALPQGPEEIIERIRMLEHEHVAAGGNRLEAGVGDRGVELLGERERRHEIFLRADDEGGKRDLVQAAADVEGIAGV